MPPEREKNLSSGDGVSGGLRGPLPSLLARNPPSLVWKAQQSREDQGAGGLLPAEPCWVPLAARGKPWGADGAVQQRKQFALRVSEGPEPGLQYLEEFINTS